MLKKMSKERKIYLAMIDIYKEFNYAVNHLIILREFLIDILDLKNNENFIYDYPSVFNKFKNK